MLPFKNKKTIFFLVLLLFYVQACINPFEQEGSCTKCLPTENLENGFCYLKLRGCFLQQGTNCVQCQVGYILSENLCIREAQYFNLTTLVPSPQKIEESSITQSEITPVIVGGFKPTVNFSSPTYIQAKSVLYKEYPFLSTYNVSKVEEQLVNGINYIFYIINTDSGDLYLTKVYVTFQLEASVEEIYKNDDSIKKGTPVSSQLSAPVPGGWQQFMNISDQKYKESLNLIENAFPGVENYKLSRVEYQIVAGVLFAFFYDNDTTRNVFTVEVYKPFYGQAIIQNAWGLKPNTFQLVSSASNTNQSTVAGGSQTISSSQYNSEQFLTAKSAILQVFPTFDVSLVKNISQQVVAGWNVEVSFTLPNSTDLYDVLVFIPLPYTGDQPSISSIKKNGLSYDPLVQQNQQNFTPTSSTSNTQMVSPTVGGFTDTTNFNNSLFIQANMTLFSQYPQLAAYSITKVQEQVVNGMNYLFYINDSATGDQYVAKVYVSLQLSAAVQSITKNNVDISNQSAPTSTQTPANQTANLTSESNETSTKQTNNSTNTLVGDFTPTITGGYSLTTDFTSQFYIKANSTLYSKYPFLENLTVSKVEEQVVSGKNYRFTILNNSDIYIAVVCVTLSLEASVSEITKNNVSIITVEQKTNDTTLTVVSSTKQNLASGQTSSTGSNEDVLPSEYNSGTFLPIIQTINKIIPNFNVNLITKATKQIVAGWNYFITFSFPNSNDEYEVKVYQPLPYTGLGPSVQQIKKNGVSVDLTSFSNSTNEIYSWQNDTIFTQLYKFFKKEINVNNLLPILQVSREKKQNNSVNWYEYKITFSKEEYALCRYYQDYQIFEVISYVISGTEMYSISGRVGYGIYDLTENDLIKQLKINNLKRFSRIMIGKITSTKLSNYYRIYAIDGYTFEGHFQLIFLDNGNLSLIQTTQLDSNTSYPINFTRQVQYRQEYIVDQIRTFLFAKYNLTGFEITMADANASNNVTNQYLILLSRADLRKIRILVEESNGIFVIKKIDLLNNGLAFISDVNFQKSIEDLARKEYPTDLSGYDRVMILSNGTLNVAKFASESAVLTYAKCSSSLSIGVLNKEQFIQSNPCLIVKPLTVDTCEKCNGNDFLWKGKCYTKITNCLVQAGSVCIMCDRFSIESNGKCLKDCPDIFNI